MLRGPLYCHPGSYTPASTGFAQSVEATRDEVAALTLAFNGFDYVRPSPGFCSLWPSTSCEARQVGCFQSRPRWTRSAHRSLAPLPGSLGSSLQPARRRPSSSLRCPLPSPHHTVGPHRRRHPHPALQPSTSGRDTTASWVIEWRPTSASGVAYVAIYPREGHPRAAGAGIPHYYIDYSKDSTYAS